MKLILLPVGVGLIGIVFAIIMAIRVMRRDPGSKEMVYISLAIYEGAMAFLKREYLAILIFVSSIFILLALGLRSQGAGFAFATAIAYLVGAGCSMASGFFGLRIATRANTRTAEAAKSGLNQALSVAFPGGSVMGLTVVGLGLFALSLMYFIYTSLGGDLMTRVIWATGAMAGFSMGASSVALFARVGGGIYTKAADIGADLVGKVEAGIPEDDPRNPATIADNVGDNVGDVAGMGADLYESYVGSIVAGIVIAATMKSIDRILLVFFLVCIGLIASILGVFFVHSKSDAQRALRNGTIASAILFILGALLLCTLWFGRIETFFAVLAGILCGLIIGFTAEYYTSGKAVREIANSAKTGAATNIIAGLATGMTSTVIPIVVIAVAIVVAFKLEGFFGIALAGIGMLSIAGMTISVDAYGPIADNAGGIAQMAKLSPRVREVTDSLDAAGNTTAAIAKGFAIGSAALTALALFSAYIKVSKLPEINMMKATVIAGLFIGGVVPYVFASATMKAVGRSAFRVVEEVRRQFREIKGLMEGEARPDYARCVDITTRGALREMILPGVLAVMIPLVVGIFFGTEALGGLLAGSLVVGVPLAVFMANSGGAWDNAKKWIEKGNLGGKGSDTHKSSVVGDTVGDPFKDTSAPSMNILLKLMAVVSLVFAPIIILLNKHIGLFH